ncbi:MULTISPECIES: glycine zipper 2TM domain-containing protein [Burkholderia]|uniref:Glycine zipper 2TM domain-containing protein n=1 Tax=Burkholderia savannae TaxID=1637837 RepID=A0ABR5TC97_9BURK|nr:MULTISPECIES: glycine zipper 2TM domain-containing protein [Burkholderia]AOJ68365.1 hypothetical protein WS78_06050 [Burkholderia savannae]AOJ80420.1 hypothetical protein WS86_07155 [Burkholderia savannae]AOK46639.1 hypothetical protein WT60_07085 [Burkholderia sp. MSMB617WGS]KGS00943.1 glycine zipper 2TM domain protein [Burkholderia sp. ABCPW 111]KVG41935.1 hypothetical protein WS77_16090 [Burkholderia sp. MSMB0265]
MDNQNTTTQQRQRIHPLVATAAGAVIIASLAATAAVTGLFPKASSTDAQNPQTQAALIASQPAVDTAAAASAALAAQAAQQQAAQRQAVAQAAPKPAPRPARHHHTAAAPQPPQYAQQSSQQPQSSYCATCGTVASIVPVRTAGTSSGIGAIGGAAAGGLVGNQFGHGNGRTAMTIIGALGGGLAGNAVEKQVRSETDYQVQVQMQDGSTRTFTYHNPPPFGQGQRVRVENGTLVGA